MIASGGSVHLTGSTLLRARAWKPGLIASSSSFAQFDINIPLYLLLDVTGPAANQVAALDSMLFVRDPFPVINQANLFNRAVI